jgi:hypothetical protein
MDAVTAFSETVRACRSSQLITKGTVWVMRVLRLFAPKGETGSAGSLTENYAFLRAGQRKIAGRHEQIARCNLRDDAMSKRIRGWALKPENSQSVYGGQP